MTVDDATVKAREQHYRDLKKDRPRCKAKRLQLVTPKPVKGQPTKPPLMMNLTCGRLLDSKGKCWFCGHVDRAVRKAYLDAQDAR